MTPQAVLPALTLAQWFICKANLRWKAKCSEQAVPFCPGEYFLSEVWPASEFFTNSRGKSIRLLNGLDQVSIVAWLDNRPFPRVMQILSIILVKKQGSQQWGLVHFKLSHKNHALKPSWRMTWLGKQWPVNLEGIFERKCYPPYSERHSKQWESGEKKLTLHFSTS